MAIREKPWQFLGLSGGVAALVMAFMMSVSKDASIALSVAEQHGAELMLIRSDITVLRDYIHARTKMRYTTEDADRDMRYVQKELNAIERNIAKLQESHK